MAKFPIWGGILLVFVVGFFSSCQKDEEPSFSAKIVCENSVNAIAKINIPEQDVSILTGERSQSDFLDFRRGRAEQWPAAAVALLLEDGTYQVAFPIENAVYNCNAIPKNGRFIPNSRVDCDNIAVLFRDCAFDCGNGLYYLNLW